MAKETFYFSHDYNARNDPKLQKVLMRLGHVGKSVFWDLIEMLYEQEGYLKLGECDNYAFALRTDATCIASLINDFDLFQKDSEKFWSDSVLRRLEQRNIKSEKARNSALNRWSNANALKKDATAVVNESEGNAIKESKVNEIYNKYSFFDSDFKVVWKSYLKMRVAIRKTATENAEKLVLNKLQDMTKGNKELAIKIVEQSIENSWQGVFPLRTDNHNPKKQNQVIDYANIGN